MPAHHQAGGPVRPSSVSSDTVRDLWLIHSASWGGVRGQRCRWVCARHLSPRTGLGFTRRPGELGKAGQSLRERVDAGEGVSEHSRWTEDNLRCVSEHSRQVAKEDRTAWPGAQFRRRVMPAEARAPCSRANAPAPVGVVHSLRVKSQ